MGVSARMEKSWYFKRRLEHGKGFTGGVFSLEEAKAIFGICDLDTSRGSDGEFVFNVVFRISAAGLSYCNVVAESLGDGGLYLGMCPNRSNCQSS